ncbi:MAG: membrane protein insertase YidC [Pseudomonadota bacterium]
MQNQRLFAWALFGLLLLMTWQQWQEDYGPQPPAQAASADIDVDAMPGSIPGEPDALPADELDALPELGAPSNGAPADTDVTPQLDALPAADRTLITVKTDVLNIKIDPQGGDIVSATLPTYPVDKDTPDVLVELLSDQPSDFAVFRSGLATRDSKNGPNHRAMFAAAQTEYELTDGATTLEVPLVWQGAYGVVVTKRYTFEAGQYGITLDLDIENRSEAAWDAAPYARIVHVAEVPKRSLFDVDSYSFAGPVTFDGGEYDKHTIKDLGKSSYSASGVTGGWVAAIEHHFLSAIVPPAESPSKLEAKLSGDQFLAGFVGEAVRVEAGATTTIPVELFVGPKLQDQLRTVSDRLPLTVDYGILTLLADPLFWVLSKVHSVIGNWGWAIVLVTLLIKLVFYKLTEQSGRSMAKMRNLQPRLKALQERYKDDRQKLSEAMMDLYKREKVNPAAGCLPILIQMPFFLAFYWVLLESVEMRQAPFMLWINDLSSRDPLFILPLLMGAAMLAQQQLNPAPADPIQARVMRILPIVFTVFFAFFPAGLVLYWFTNTILGVAQQWQINRVVTREGLKQRA